MNGSYFYDAVTAEVATTTTTMKFSELKRLREESRVILQATSPHSTAVTGTTMKTHRIVKDLLNTCQKHYNTSVWDFKEIVKSQETS